MKTLLLFDLDGTLLDTLQDLTDSVNHTLAQYGCPERTEDEIRQFLGNGARQLLALSLPGRENDPPLDEFLEAYKAYYALHSQDKTAPFEGIMDALEQLQEYPIAIVSNKPDIYVKPLCQRYFPKLYARGETPDCPRKPAPDMLLQTMTQLGYERCIYIGDSEVDIRTAQNAGCPCISVTWGFRTPEQLTAAGAAHLCHSPMDLPAMIKKLEED